MTGFNQSFFLGVKLNGLVPHDYVIIGINRNDHVWNIARGWSVLNGRLR